MREYQDCSALNNLQEIFLLFWLSLSYNFLRCQKSMMFSGKVEMRAESSQSVAELVGMQCNEPWEVFNLLTMRNRSTRARSLEFLSGVELEVVEVVTQRWTSPALLPPSPHSLIVTYYCCGPSQQVQTADRIYLVWLCSFLNNSLWKLIAPFKMDDCSGKSSINSKECFHNIKIITLIKVCF